MFLLILAFLLFSSTFAHMVIAGIADAETGGNLGNLAFSLTLVFCGVLATPTALPGFWIFMYRISPFTYLVEGMLATAVSDTSASCAANEFLKFTPPSGQTCATYMQAYMARAGGYLEDGTAQNTANCSFCQLDSTNAFLSQIATDPSHKWRDLGLMFIYICFNVFGAIVLYWLVRVPKTPKNKKETGRQQKQQQEQEAKKVDSTTPVEESREKIKEDV